MGVGWGTAAEAVGRAGVAPCLTTHTQTQQAGASQDCCTHLGERFHGLDGVGLRGVLQRWCGAQGQGVESGGGTPTHHIR